MTKMANLITVIVYPNNSLCIGGKYQSFDPEFFKQYGIPVERRVIGANADRYQQPDLVVGNYRFKIFYQPAHKKSYIHDPNRPDRNKMMCSRFDQLQSQGVKQKSILLELATEFKVSSSLIRAVVFQKRRNGKRWRAKR